jgi:hypothetical protein
MTGYLRRIAAFTLGFTLMQTIMTTQYLLSHDGLQNDQAVQAQAVQE